MCVASLRILLPFRVATIIIRKNYILLLLLVICVSMPLTVRLLLSKHGLGIFNMHNDLEGIDKSAQVLTQKK